LIAGDVPMFIVRKKEQFTAVFEALDEQGLQI